MPTRALILAAGRGSRLGALTVHRPKCLLPLAGETLLSRQLRLLDEAGIHDVVVVAGYRAADIAARFRGLPGVALISNPAFEGNGSISSLAAAKHELAGDILILNCDLAYEPEMLASLLSSGHGLTLALSRTRAQSLHVPVLLAGHRVVDIGKHIPSCESHASFCCAALVRDSQLASFSGMLERCAESSLRTGWSRVFACLAAEGVEVGAADYEGHWSDINSVRSYVAARAWAEAGDRA
jgi:choline kinase